MEAGVASHTGPSLQPAIQACVRMPARRHPHAGTVLGGSVALKEGQKQGQPSPGLGGGLVFW